jgi:dTDP-4-dehydrorhamnose reductase
VRWLVTGANGMLGRDLVERLSVGHQDVVGADRRELDITDSPAVVRAVAGTDVVVNCAAWTDVDGAETDESAATAVNGDGPRILARACRTAGARLVHLSTDYVFAGDASTPYAENAALDPVSAYGRSKAAGEVAVRGELPDDHVIVRTAWLYGEHGPSFPRTIARLARERGVVSVVDDQQGQPTWTVDVADLVVRLVEAGVPRGTYHATAAGSTTWFAFARDVVAAAGLSTEIVTPTTTAAFPRPARRPAYSVLGHRALVDAGVAPIGDWRERWSAASARVLG